MASANPAEIAPGDSADADPGTQDPVGKAGRTRHDILATAARMFRSSGFQATTMRRIAEATGLEAGSIYYHFRSKEQILDEVLDIGLRQLFDEMAAIVAEAEGAGRPFRATFARMLDAHLNFLLHRSDFTSANIRNYPMLSEERRRAHRPLRRAYADLWGDFLGRAQAAGLVRSDIAVAPVRQFILGAMNWTVEWYDVARHPVSDLSERMATLLLDGMCVKHGPGGGPPPEAGRSRLDLPEPARKGAQTRGEILRAAARIMRDSGYRAATVRRIAAEAALEPGSVYYHFASKDQIVDEVLDTGLRDLIEGFSRAMERLRGEPDLRLRLAAAIATHMAYLFRASEFTSANIRAYGMLPTEFRRRHRAIRHQYADLWDGLLAEAQRGGVLRSDIKVMPLRQLLLGALNWTVEWFDPAKASGPGHYTLAGFSDMLVTLLLDGICAHSGMAQAGPAGGSDQQEVV